MELAPELQFRHYTLGAVCCDLDSHVFNPAHTDPRIVEALRGTHWIDVHEFPRPR